ncbi:hypothetical protein M885DRAFT_616099 [Pelagophyceae sp. CCMP2097]|nr:hypothetical protein M885DRAFT_616099 [Pelagophyceae sp. CCMP2097]
MRLVGLLLALAVCATASEDPAPVLRLVEPETGPTWFEAETVSVALDVGGASWLARDIREAPDSFSLCKSQRYGIDGDTPKCHALDAPPVSLAPVRLDADVGLNGVWVVRAWLMRIGDDARHAQRVAYLWQPPNATAACDAPSYSKASKRRAARLAFYLGPLNERGTHVATFDYADFAETLLGAKTVALLYVRPANDAGASAVYKGVFAKFEARFPGALFPLNPRGFTDGPDGEAAALEQLAAINAILLRAAATHVLHMHYGHVAWLTHPSVISRAMPARTAVTCVHAVFEAIQPHGDRYARISRSVPAATDVAVVPYVLGIPAGATVFGRHGGRDTFDIPFVRDVVVDVARRSAAMPGPLPSNIIFLDGTAEDAAKSAFVLTCDAMLHARTFGESFGLSVAEFAAHGRPVLTSSVHTNGGDARHHLEALGERGTYYADAATLHDALMNFDRASVRRSAAYYAGAAYDSPVEVMEQFAHAFIDVDGA